MTEEPNKIDIFAYAASDPEEGEQGFYAVVELGPFLTEAQAELMAGTMAGMIDCINARARPNSAAGFATHTTLKRRFSMVKCSHNDCQSEASFVPKLCVPLMGWPIDTHQPVSVIIDLPVCQWHQVKLKVTDFMNDTMRQSIEAAAAGRVDPDFRRAYLTKVRIDGEEHRLFKQMCATEEGK